MSDTETVVASLLIAVAMRGAAVDGLWWRKEKRRLQRDLEESRAHVLKWLDEQRQGGNE